jgi:hypothetical protein
MKKYFLTLAFSVALIIAAPSVTLSASEPLKPDNDSISDVDFSFNADIVSRYIWRGLPLNLNPNIQPYASVSYKNFTFGTWGSYAFADSYAEVDLYLAYDLGAFTFSVQDYFNEDEMDLASSDYLRFFDTDTYNTLHSFEGQVTFNGTDKLPVSVTLATFFYGNDKNAENKNYYSTYLELGYEHNLGENTLSYFLGGTLGEGYYAGKAALVNVGFTASRELKFSEAVSIPVSASLILNPAANDIFFVFSLTF